MRVIVVNPPEPVITLDEIDRHIKLEGDEDAIQSAEAYRDAATAHIDGPNGWLGRCVGKQTLEARLDNWDCGSIRLPYPPVVSVVAVTYLDAAGVVQTVAPDAYELLGASLVPAYGHSWPQPRWQREAVRVRYVAGYEDAPAPIKAAILLMAADLFRNRSQMQIGATAVEVPMSTRAESLLSTYRVYG